jgi:hypothetical protein
MTSQLDSGNWQEVDAALAERIQETRGQSPIYEMIKKNATVAETAYFGNDLTSSRGMRGGSAVRVFWWGFHIQISHEDLPTLLSAADTVHALVSLVGGNIPSPAQPWIRLVTPFISAALQWLPSLDRGRGIYISMSWFLPGHFIPTTV